MLISVVIENLGFLSIVGVPVVFSLGVPGVVALGFPDKVAIWVTGKFIFLVSC